MSQYHRYAEAKAASQQLKNEADGREGGNTPEGQRIRTGGKQLAHNQGEQSQTKGSSHPEGLHMGTGGKPNGWAGRLKSLFTISGRGAQSLAVIMAHQGVALSLLSLLWQLLSVCSLLVLLPWVFGCWHVGSGTGTSSSDVYSQQGTCCV